MIENYADAVNKFVAFARTGAGDAAAFIAEIPKLQSPALWQAVAAINASRLPREQFYEAAIRIFHLPAFNKYIEYSFTRFIPCQEFAAEVPEARSRALEAVRLACGYRHLLPAALTQHLEELRALAIFHRHSRQYGDWSGSLRAIEGLEEAAPAAPTDIPLPPPTLWERFFTAASIGLDYDLPDPSREIERLQLAKLARLAQEIIHAYASIESPELLRLLELGLPPVVRSLCIKPPGHLGPDGMRQATTILANLVEFFQLYAAAKPLGGVPADILFRQTPNFNLDAALLRFAAVLPPISRDLDAAIREAAAACTSTFIDTYLNSQYVGRILERLLEAPIDFENYEREPPHTTDYDPEYSYKLGTLLSELMAAIIKCGPGGGLAAYLVTGLLSFSKQNGDILQRAHREFLAGTCSMKPLIILHHLAVDSGRRTNLHQPPRLDLRRAILERIRAAAASSYLAAAALHLGSGLLGAIIDTCLEIAADTRLIHLFLFYLLRA